jgi:hypothetical protein
MVPGLTDHARIRMQQRGIPEAALDALLDYGRSVHDHRGAEIVYFDKHSRDRLVRERGLQAARCLERYLDAYAVVGGDGEIRTVGHRRARIPSR